MNKNLYLKYVIAILVIVGFFALLIFLIYKPIPENNRTLLDMVVGALVGCFSTIVAYHWGSSAGSAEKSDVISRLAEKKNGDG